MKTRAKIALVVAGYVGALPATGSALFFLRPYPSFWRVLSVVAPAIAATGLAAFVVYFAAQTAGAGSLLHSWSGLAVLRILVAPLLALAFLLSSLFASSRSSRIALFVVALIEAAAFAGVALMWFRT